MYLIHGGYILLTSYMKYIFFLHLYLLHIFTIVQIYIIKYNYIYEAPIVCERHERENYIVCYYTNIICSVNKYLNFQLSLLKILDKSILSKTRNVLCYKLYGLWYTMYPIRVVSYDIWFSRNILDITSNIFHENI